MKRSYADRLLELCERSRAAPLWIQLAGATAVLVAALGSQAALSDYTHRYPLLFFFAANAANGLLWRLPVALTAVLVAAVVVDYGFIVPTGSLALHSMEDAVALLAFMAIGSFEVLALQALITASSRLRAALAELLRAEARQQVLTREMHHRIKNNIQTISSMFSIAALRESDPQVRRKLNAALGRIDAIATVQKLLHDGGAPRALDAHALLGAICEGVRRLHGRPEIELAADIEPAPLDPEAAQALGLIVNEALTNAYKYGFRDDRGGVIRVSLRREGHGALRLEIVDDGFGFDTTAGRQGVGLMLIGVLARQLGAELQVDGAKGGRLELRIPAAEAVEKAPSGAGLPPRPTPVPRERQEGSAPANAVSSSATPRGLGG